MSVFYWDTHINCENKYLMTRHSVFQQDELTGCEISTLFFFSNVVFIPASPLIYNYWLQIWSRLGLNTWCLVLVQHCHLEDSGGFTAQHGLLQSCFPIEIIHISSMCLSLIWLLRPVNSSSFKSDVFTKCHFFFDSRGRQCWTHWLHNCRSKFTQNRSVEKCSAALTFDLYNQVAFESTLSGNLRMNIWISSPYSFANNLDSLFDPVYTAAFSGEKAKVSFRLGCLCTWGWQKTERNES